MISKILRCALFLSNQRFWGKKIWQKFRRALPWNLQKMADLSLYVIQDRKIRYFHQNQRFWRKKKHDLIWSQRSWDVHFFSQISDFGEKKIQKKFRQALPWNLQKMADLSLCGLGGFPHKCFVRFYWRLLLSYYHRRHVEHTYEYMQLHVTILLFLKETSRKSFSAIWAATEASKAAFCAEFDALH